MHKVSILDDYDTVTNIILVTDDWATGGLRVGPEGGEIGDIWDGTSYLKPPELDPEKSAPEPAPQSQGVAISYIIDPSQTEALVSLQNQIDALNANAEAARQAAIDNPAPVMSDSQPVVDLSHLEAALADKDAEIAGMRAKQDVLEAKMNAILEEAQRVGGEAS